MLRAASSCMHFREGFALELHCHVCVSGRTVCEVLFQGELCVMSCTVMCIFQGGLCVKCSFKENFAL